MLKRVFISITISLLIISCINPNPESDIATAEETTKTSVPETPSLVSTRGANSLPYFVAEQSQNGVTTAITWTYSDKYRFAFEVYIYGINIPIGYELPCPIQKVSVIDKAGYTYNNYEKDLDKSNDLFIHCMYQPSVDAFVFTYNHYHEREFFHDMHEKIEISLGNFEIFSESGQQTLLPPFGTYTFNLIFFSNEQFTFEPNISVENSEVIATLQRVEINPSFVTSNLCLQFEDSHGWYPEISILSNDITIPANPELTLWTNYDPSLDWYESFSSFRCYRFTFPAKLIENSILQTNKIDILLSNIIINYKDAIIQEECANIRIKIQKTFPDLDFICHIDYRGDGYGFGLEIIKTPANMSIETAHQIVEENFMEVISGPWLFSVNLP